MELSEEIGDLLKTTDFTSRVKKCWRLLQRDGNYNNHG
jgi:hypothetical protein